MHFGLNEHIDEYRFFKTDKIARSAFSAPNSPIFVFRHTIFVKHLAKRKYFCLYVGFSNYFSD